MKKTINDIQIDQMGFAFYDFLPEGFTVAKYEDLFDIRGKPLLGRRILIKSQLTPFKFWANKIKEGFPYPHSDMVNFIADGHVYLYTIFA